MLCYSRQKAVDEEEEENDESNDINRYIFRKTKRKRENIEMQNILCKNRTSFTCG